MRVIDFYAGFEGEEEIILYADNLELHMWEGYFDPIMDVVFDVELERYQEAFGVVCEYHTSLVGRVSLPEKHWSRILKKSLRCWKLLI